MCKKTITKTTKTYTYTCRSCCQVVDPLSTRLQHCHFSEGHHFCHSSFNDIVLHALKSANIPSRLEPSRLGDLSAP